jgi:mono/diheme cytochrome c family protein
VETSTVLVVTLVVLVPAAMLWAIYISRTGRARRPHAILRIPQALRPAQPDEVLEGPRLQRIQAWGLVATAATAAFIPLYWLPEQQRQESFVERFNEESLRRGSLIFAVAPELEEDASAEQFKEQERALSLGQGCASCHGPSANTAEGEVIPEDSTETAGGGLATPAFTDPVSGKTVAYTAPPLNTVFSRWDREVVKFTVERGRPGTPMPAWGVEFGGSMTEMMVNDVVNWLRAIQVPPPEISQSCRNPSPIGLERCGQEIFEARCAVCHGPEGQGKEGRGVVDTGRGINDPWFQGMALWKGDVRHLPENLHEATIINGRRFAFMPAWGEAPAQGIPIPPMPLTANQIKAVMAYERTL